MVELLRNRIAENIERIRREVSMGFPVSHQRERSPRRREADRQPSRSCSSNTGHRTRCDIPGSPSPIRRSRSPTATSALLTNHKLKRVKNGDAHAGYIHPDLDDLRHSQQSMTDYLLAQIKPTPDRGKVVPLKRHIA